MSVAAKVGEGCGGIERSGIWGAGRMGGKVPGIRSINGRYKIDRGRLRVV